MDFSYRDEQEAVRELADRIFSERATHERLKEVERAAAEDPAGLSAGGPFDRSLWSELAAAGLLGIGLPEEVGGAGLDFVAECLVIEAAGRTAAYVPYLESVVLAAGTINRWGTREQRQRWLPSLGTGETVATAATAELVGDVVVPGLTRPNTVATKTDGGWRLQGTKACVPSGMVADFVLVPVTLESGAGSVAGSTAGSGSDPGSDVGVLVVEAAALGGVGGSRRTPQLTTTGRVEALIDLDGVEVPDDALLGGAGADGADGADGGLIVADLFDRGAAALCILEAGACAAALALTSDYTRTREQFDKPIATFQAVGQRAADAYVDAEAVRLTAWQAVWRLSTGLPSTAEIATAKYWAAEGGQRVVHAAAHLHGGVGVDKDYPLHRFFLLTEQVELTLGAAVHSLLRLGAHLAAEPVA